MTSEELHREITARVSDRFDPAAYRQSGEKTVRSCSECRDAYEAELERKMVVRQRYADTGPVATVPDAMERSLEAISRAETRRRSSYRRRSKRSGAGVPLLILLALILGLGAYIVLFDDAPEQPAPVSGTSPSSSSGTAIPAPTRRSTGPVNLFNQAIANYESFMSGNLQVEYEENALASLKTVFAEQGVPPLSFTGVSMPLAGGVVSERGGVKLPHLLYRDGESRLYLTEIPLATLKEGKGFYVTEDVLAQIEVGEPIWMEASAKGNLVMYRKGDDVIVAVANRSSADLKSLLGL